MDIKAISEVVMPFVTLVGVIFVVYRQFREPDIKANDRLNLIEQRCLFTHKNIDENILAIKENHLRHLEEDMREIKEKILPDIEIELVKINAKIDAVLKK